MSDESALQNIRNGISNVKRMLTLWFACVYVVYGVFGLVLDVTIIDEPFGWSLHVSTLVAVGATGIVYRRFPTIRTGTVLRFSVTAFLVAIVLAMSTNTLNAKTSGSPYYIMTASCNSIAALAIGYIVASTDDWRELLPSVFSANK